MADHPTPLPPPSDPWAGRAAVPPPPEMPPTNVMPEVIFVREPRRRRWPWVLGIFALLGILCCGLCLVFTTDIRQQYPSRIAVMPQEIHGLRRSDNAVVRAIAGEAEHRFRLEHSVDDAFADVYTDPRSAERNVLVFGATLLIVDPAGELEKAIQSAGETVSAVSAFDAGAMGGELKCANGQDDQGEPVVVCAWVDHGSLGIGVFYGKRPMADSAAILRAIREKIIIRP